MGCSRFLCRCVLKHNCLFLKRFHQNGGSIKHSKVTWLIEGPIVCKNQQQARVKWNELMSLHGIGSATNYVTLPVAPGHIFIFDGTSILFYYVWHAEVGWFAQNVINNKIFLTVARSAWPLTHISWRYPSRNLAATLVLCISVYLVYFTADWTIGLY